MLAAASIKLAKHVVARQSKPSACGGDAPRHKTVERTSASNQVLVFNRIFWWAVIRRDFALEHFVGDFVVEVQTVAQHTQLLDVHFFNLVGGVAAFNFWAESPTLNGFCQNRCGAARTKVVGRGLERRVHLAVVVAATGERLQFDIGEVRHHFTQAWVGAEEVFTDVVAVFDRVALKLAIHRGIHLVEQHPRHVAGQQLVPLRAPHHFDDVPTCATKRCFEFLDDLAIAAHGAVEALEVAIDDKDQVVEVLARCQRNCA